MNLKNFPKRVDSKTSCLRITVPENLDLALEGLIRKVLKEQPKTDDIHSFAANYFETLLKIRDKAGTKYTSAPLCPFHNDEDAHEMFKLASNFNKPIETRNQLKEKPKREKEKRKAKGSKGVKPDLIKTVSTAEDDGEGERKQSVAEEVKGSGEKLLGSDPIKELVEKELMESAKGKEEQKERDVKESSENVEKESKTEPEKITDSTKTEVKEETPDVKETTETARETENNADVTTASDEDSKNTEKVTETSKEETIEYDNVEKAKLGEDTNTETSKVEKETEVSVEDEPQPTETAKIEKESEETTGDVIPDHTNQTNVSGESLQQGTNEQQVENASPPEVELKSDSNVENGEPESHIVNNNDIKHDVTVEPTTDEFLTTDDNKNIKENETTERTTSDVKPLTGDESEREANMSKADVVENKNGVSGGTEAGAAEDRITKAQTEPNTAEEGKEGRAEGDLKKDENEEVIESEVTRVEKRTIEPELSDSKPENKIDAVENTDESEKPGEIQKEEREPESTDSTQKTEPEETCAVVNTQQEGETGSSSGVDKEDGRDTTEGEKEPEEGEIEGQEKEGREEPEELCTVVDVQHIPQEPGHAETQNISDELPQDTTEDKVEESVPESQEVGELCTVVDVEQIPKKPQQEVIQNTEDKHTQDAVTESQKQEDGELCTVVDVQQIPQEPRQQEIPTTEDKHTQNTVEDKAEKEDIAGSQKPEELSTVVDSQHIIRVEELEPATEKPSPAEVQVKTIQTHYYDTLKVPEATAKELRVHSVTPPSASDILNVASAVPALPIIKPTAEGDNPENVSVEPLISATAEQQSTEAVSQLGVDTQRSETEDLSELMTPSSGYSLNLSELSWQTISGMFLDSERQHSSVELEKVRYSKSTEPILRSEDVTQNTEEKLEVKETFHKTILSSDVRAVPVPPRDEEEINREASIQICDEPKGNEKAEEKAAKKEEDSEPEEPFGNSAEGGSSNGKSIDSDTPLISVEVKTVIESQILDDDEEDGQVEVQIEATVEVEEKPGGTGGEEMSDTKETASTRQETLKISAESTSESAAGRESTSNESDTTTSSAVTEIKRTDSGKRNMSSGRSFLSSQSLDLGRRNPLLRTRSLSTFRRGVTDFEVWNAIEKELEEAATKIQSRFRSYKNRKKLIRENAVQIATDESSVSTTPAEVERQQSTGEFHDSIVLSDHPR